MSPGSKKKDFVDDTYCDWMAIKIRIKAKQNKPCIANHVLNINKIYTSYNSSYPIPAK